MDFWVAIKVLGRRWYVFFPALLWSLGIVAIVLHEVNPNYEAKSIVLLVPPTVNPNTTNSVVPGPTNPYLGFGNLSTVAAILSASETSPAAVTQLRSAGVTDSYNVTTDPLGQVPELVVTVDGSREASTASQLQTIVGYITNQIRTKQAAAGGPPSQWITTQTLATSVSAQNKSRYRLAGTVGALGIAVSIALAFMAESIAKRDTTRRRRTIDSATPGAASRVVEQPFGVAQSPALQSQPLEVPRAQRRA